MLSNNNYFYITIIMLISFYSCIEPIKIENIAFEDRIVIKSIITNEFKNHIVNISKTIRIDSSNIVPVNNALVLITDNNNVIHPFKDKGNGIYESINKFKAEPSKSYTLEVQTSKGKKYISSAEELPSTSEIKDIYVNVEKKELEKPKAIIKVNSIGRSNTKGKFYRYEYEETYKVQTAVWSNKKIIVISDQSPYEFDLISKSDEDGIGFCYGTNKSKNIILTETKSLSENKVIGFPVRSIPIDNHYIGIRYSILLKQYVINNNSYDYYDLLNKFSDPDNIFSQVQVGEIPSNISSNTGEKVIGFFEVSSISSKRVFFNREEVTPISEYINYGNTSAKTCANTIIYPKVENSFGESPMLNSLENYIFAKLPENPNPPKNLPYVLISKVCGDCTHIGPVKKPEFWID